MPRHPGSRPLKNSTNSIFSSPSRRRAFRGRLDRRISPYLFVAPFFIVFVVTGLFPIGYTAYVSLHHWELLGGQGDYVGLGNFAVILHQRTFWIALRNTLSIFLLSSVPQIVIALFLASMLHANLRARTFWRMGVLVPYVLAPVAVSLIFGRVFADQSGLANALLQRVGLGPIAWHAGPLAGHIAIASMVAFRWIGYNTLILLAAMQAVPRDLYEAAVIDGANRWRQFWSVSLPMLRPTLVFVILTSTIGGLQIFDEPRLFGDNQAGARGGGSNQFMTLTMYLQYLGWGDLRNGFGRASAVAWLLFMLIVLIAAVNLLLIRRMGGGSAASHRLSRTARTATRQDGR